MNRRSLLLGLGAALAAPAVVRASSLMKIAVLRESVKPWVIEATPGANFADYLFTGTGWEFIRGNPDVLASTCVQLPKTGYRVGQVVGILGRRGMGGTSRA